MVLLLIFSILLLLFLIPIPLKITIIVDKNYYALKLFKLTIFSPDKGIGNKYLSRIISNVNNNRKNKSSSKDIKSESNTSTPNSKKLKAKKLSLKLFYLKITQNKFKPGFLLKGDLYFDLEDSAYTAISYGLLCNLNPLIIFFIDKIFSIKEFDLKIHPLFKGSNLLKFNITSIFYTNIAQIIYILYLTYKSYIKIEEVTPL
ncbi:hypothetical protein JCM1393_27460 [Clostridium carnis]